MKLNLLGLPPTLHYRPLWKALKIMAFEETRSPTCPWLPSSHGATEASHYDQTYYHVELVPWTLQKFRFLQSFLAFEVLLPAVSFHGIVQSLCLGCNVGYRHCHCATEKSSTTLPAHPMPLDGSFC